MRAWFLGTPSIAVPALAALVDVSDVVGVVTRPDRPRGRSGKEVTTPVKAAADDWGLPVFQPGNRVELESTLASLEADIALVVAYGRILTTTALRTTRLGFVNVHFSLLPRWRGPAPVERAIAAGDASTGVSLMLLDEGVDTGPVISVIETPIADDETGGSLSARLSHLGARIVDDALPEYVAGRLQPAPQIEAAASYAALLAKSDAELQGGLDVSEALRAVRAFHPRPGAWVATEDGRLGVESAGYGFGSVGAGDIVSIDGRPVLGLRDGSIELLTVKPEGRGLQSGVAWMNGRRGAATRLA